MSSTIATDPRLDPRIKNTMGAMPTLSQADVDSREPLLEEAASEKRWRPGSAGWMPVTARRWRHRPGSGLSHCPSPRALTARHPGALACPSFASEDDLRGLVPTVISVNECDPLRDEGIEFYRSLLRAGVSARCRQVMGTSHGVEIFAICCPDISRETAGSIAQFCREA